LPLGAFSHSISYNSLIKVCEIKDESNTEIWGAYFTESGFFKCGTLVADPEDTWPELRLTVDYPEDFEFVTRIFDELYYPGEIFSLQDIIKLCRTRNELIKINASVKQKTGKPIKLKT
jgi:spore coat polysaccharide biosynthesis protein SpsF